MPYGVVQRMMIDAPSYESGKKKTATEKPLTEDAYQAIFEKIGKN